MTIGTDALIEFFGSETDITNASNGTIVADAYSAAGDIDTWDNSDDSPMAVFALGYAAASAPTAGGWVALYATLVDIDDANNDESTPTASDESAHPLGIFRIPNATSSHVSLRAVLPNAESSQTYQFFLKNKTDQTMSDTWTLKVKSVTYGPHT